MAIENPVVPLLPNFPGDEKRKAAGALAGGGWGCRDVLPPIERRRALGPFIRVEVWLTRPSGHLTPNASRIAASGKQVMRRFHRRSA